MKTSSRGHAGVGSPEQSEMHKSCSVTSSAEVGAGIAWASRGMEQVRKQVFDTSKAALMLEIGFGVFLYRKRGRAGGVWHFVQLR